MLLERILQGDASLAETRSVEAHLIGARPFVERMRDAAYLAMTLPAYQLN
jgi:hypothetical protein